MYGFETYAHYTLAIRFSTQEIKTGKGFSAASHQEALHELRAS
jgi:hypothetical protein